MSIPVTTTTPVFIASASASASASAPATTTSSHLTRELVTERVTQWRAKHEELRARAAVEAAAVHAAIDAVSKCDIDFSQFKQVEIGCFHNNKLIRSSMGPHQESLVNEKLHEISELPNVVLAHGSKILCYRYGDFVNIYMIEDFDVTQRFISPAIFNTLMQRLGSIPAPADFPKDTLWVWLRHEEAGHNEMFQKRLDQARENPQLRAEMIALAQKRHNHIV